MPSYPQARPHIPLGAQTSPPPKYILRGQTDSEADAETGGRPLFVPVLQTDLRGNPPALCARDPWVGQRGGRARDRRFRDGQILSARLGFGAQITHYWVPASGPPGSHCRHAPCRSPQRRAHHGAAAGKGPSRDGGAGQVLDEAGSPTVAPVSSAPSPPPARTVSGTLGRPRCRQGGWRSQRGSVPG